MNIPYVTNRKMVKIMLLSAVTFGIYWIVTMSKISRNVNRLSPELPGMCIYVPVALVPTAGIWPMIWMHKMSNRVGYALKQRGLNYHFSCREFWLWFVLGSALCAVGPWIYVWRLCSAMNLLGAYENAKMTGVPSDYVNKYLKTADTEVTVDAVVADATGAAGAAAGVAGATAATANAAASDASSSKVGEAFKNFGTFFANSFKKPITAAEEHFENASVADSVVALAIVAVAYTAVSFFTAIVSVIHDAIVSYWVSYGAARIVGGLFLPIFYCALMAGACLGLYCAINAILIKKPRDFKKLLAYGSSCSVGLLLCTAAYLLQRFVGALGGRSYNVLRLIGWIALAVMGFFTLLIGFVNLKKVIEDERKYVLAMLLGMAGLTVANYVISWIFGLMDPYFFSIPM